jgi:hypothetical protein
LVERVDLLVLRSLGEDRVDDLHTDIFISDMVVASALVELEEGGGVRESRVRHIGLVVFPVDEVLSPSLPLVLGVSDDQRLRREAWVANVGSGKGESIRVAGSRVNRSLESDVLIAVRVARHDFSDGYADGAAVDLSV